MDHISDASSGKFFSSWSENDGKSVDGSSHSIEVPSSLSSITFSPSYCNDSIREDYYSLIYCEEFNGEQNSSDDNGDRFFGYAVNRRHRHIDEEDLGLDIDRPDELAGRDEDEDLEYSFDGTIWS